MNSVLTNTEYCHTSNIIFYLLMCSSGITELLTALQTKAFVPTKHLEAPVAVSYTHLDVYKRQPLHPNFL